MPSEKRARQKAARRQKKQAQARRAKRRKLLRNSGIVVVLAAVVIGVVLLTTGHGSTSKSADTPSAEQTAANTAAVAAGCPASTTTRVNKLTYSSEPALTIDTAKTYSATITTTVGSFTVDLLAKTAPHTVNNFVFLAKKGYYHCVTFHRVVKSFVDQTGDPTGTGTGGPGYEFANENVPKAYATGDVAMANSGGTDTNGSQFFMVVPGGAKTLDQDLASGDAYSLFGKVTKGMSVLEKINSEGSATGKPKVVQRVLSVKIHTS